MTVTNFTAALHKYGWYGWMTPACCIPLLIVAVALVHTGVPSVRFLAFALICTAVMAPTMRGMNHRGSHS